MKNFFIAIAVLCGLLSSCISRETPCQLDNEAVKIHFELQAAPSKSSLTDDPYTKVSDANYYLFLPGSNLVSQKYIADAKDFAVGLPESEQNYSLYVIANVGEFVIPASISEKELASSIKYDYGSPDAFRTMIAEKGLPMCGKVDGFNSSYANVILLESLVQTLNVQMDQQMLNSAHLHFTAVRLRQAARDIYPFAETSKAENVVDLGDYASASDIARLNSGEAITLYTLENMRGRLLPYSTGWDGKVPSALTSEEAALSTYIEIEAEMQTPTAIYRDNVFRAYLGPDAGSFDVRRNTAFLLTNSFTGDMVNDKLWRQEKDQAQITGCLEFRYPDAGTDNSGKMVPSHNICDRELAICYGFVQTIFIYRSDPAINYTVSTDKTADDFPYLSWTVSHYDDHHDRLDIRQSNYIKASDLGEGLSGYSSGALYDPVSSFPVRFDIESDDGLLHDSFTCYVLCERFCPAFSYKGYKWGDADAAMDCEGNSNMYMTMWNPLKFEFDIKVYGSVDSYISYYPHWYNTKATVSTANMPFVCITSGIPDMTGLAIDENRYSLASPQLSSNDLTGYSKREVNSSWTNTLLGMSRSLSFAYNGFTIKDIVQRDGCASINDACAYLQLSGVQYTETGPGKGSYRAARPKHINLNIEISMKEFKSGQPGLGYDGIFGPDTIFKYLTFRSLTREGGTMAPAGPPVKYRVLLGSGDDFSFGGYGWHSLDYAFTQISAKSWRTWSDANETNILDFTLHTGSVPAVYNTADIGL